MYFESVEALLQMDGHGFYVWTSYGITLVVLLFTLWLPLAKIRRLRTEQQRRLRREQQGAPSHALGAASGSANESSPEK